MRGKRVLFPRAAAAREVVPSALGAMGALVDAPETYRNLIPKDAATRIQAYLGASRRPDWITFTSPSTVTNFLSLAGAQAIAGVRVATIGPTTTGAARKQSLPVHAEASTPSVEGLIQAIINFAA